MTYYVSTFRKIILTVKDILTLGGVPSKLLHWVLYRFNANGALVATFWTANIFFLFEELPKNNLMKSVLLMSILYSEHVYIERKV